MECRILNKKGLFCTGAGVESLSPREDAWSSDLMELESREWSVEEYRSGVRVERSGVE